MLISSAVDFEFGSILFLFFLFFGAELYLFPILQRIDFQSFLFNVPVSQSIPSFRVIATSFFMIIPKNVYVFLYRTLSHDVITTRPSIFPGIIRKTCLLFETFGSASIVCLIRFLSDTFNNFLFDMKFFQSSLWYFELFHDDELLFAKSVII